MCRRIGALASRSKGAVGGCEVELDIVVRRDRVPEFVCVVGVGLVDAKSRDRGSVIFDSDGLCLRTRAEECVLMRRTGNGESFVKVEVE